MTVGVSVAGLSLLTISKSVGINSFGSGNFRFALTAGLRSDSKNSFENSTKIVERKSKLNPKRL